MGRLRQCGRTAPHPRRRRDWRQGSVADLPTHHRGGLGELCAAQRACAAIAARAKTTRRPADRSELGRPRGQEAQRRLHRTFPPQCQRPGRRHQVSACRRRGAATGAETNPHSLPFGQGSCGGRRESSNAAPASRRAVLGMGRAVGQRRQPRAFRRKGLLNVEGRRDRMAHPADRVDFGSSCRGIPH